MRFRNQKMNEKLWCYYKSTIYQSHTAPRGLWRYIYGNRSIHVELGTGKGDFILEASDVDEKLWIGIDKLYQPLQTAIYKRNIQKKNYPLLWLDVKNLKSIFTQNEVDRFYIHFCDPWPKRKHEKRRLTHPIFLQKYQYCLKKTGNLVLKTDHPKLYKYSIDQLKKAHWQIVEKISDLHNSSIDKQNIKTEYEKRFYKKGIPILYLRAIPPKH